jgi:hypothetical protein
MSELILIVEETATRRGRFDGWIEGFGQVITSSTQPFLDAARQLVRRGIDPATILTMRHRKTGTDSAGQAAKRTGPQARQSGALSATPPSVLGPTGPAVSTELGAAATPAGVTGPAPP